MSTTSFSCLEFRLLRNCRHETTPAYADTTVILCNESSISNIPVFLFVGSWQQLMFNKRKLLSTFSRKYLSTFSRKYTSTFAAR